MGAAVKCSRVRKELDTKYLITQKLYVSLFCQVFLYQKETSFK